MCQGEEMTQEMQNFINLHMLNSNSKKGNLPNNYVCPKTGSHFDGKDLIERMEQLQQKRSVLDENIRIENLRQR
jgi:non-homologous end joining protein Ku